MNENRTYNHSDKVKWAVAFLLIFVLLAGLIGAWVVLLTGDKTEDETPPAEEVETSYGGAVIGESVGNGVKLMSAKIASADYAEYGISPMADTAYTITATITPSDASDKAVDWAVAFVNPSSSWASGKNIADYVTVTPTSDGALTANVECKEGFAEQIVLTCTSRDNPDVSASCTVDYAQRVTGASLFFGDVDVNALESSGVEFEIGSNVRGQGGAVKVDYTTSSVYTVVDEFTVSVDPFINYNDRNGSGFTDIELNTTGVVGLSLADVISNAIVNRDLIDEGDLDEDVEVYFDLTFFQRFLTSYFDNVVTDTGDGWLQSSAGPVKILMMELQQGDGMEIGFDITVKGEYSTYSQTITVPVTGFVNNSVITDLTLDETGLIF